jgi:hypothetical protein
VADYFFIYLSGGMSNTGSIVTTGSSIDASHIIIASNGNATVTGSTQMGNYIMQKGTLTIGSSATLTGGVFMSTNTSTNSDELLMNSGAKIVSGAWNGIVSASAPEPLR